MTKKLSLLLVLLLVFLSSGVYAEEVLRVGATPVPHGDILTQVVPLLEEQGIKLEIIEFTDYVLPNLALNDGEIDANFFQHTPYLEGFNRDHRLNLVSLAEIHIEPLGIYSKRVSSIDEIPAGATIAIPNDPTNGGRALLLLQSAGLIKVDPKAGITPTIFDITENKLKLKFFEIEAAQLARTLDDTTAAVINGNYALLADLVPTRDALFLEGAESPYANVLAVRAEDVNNPALLKLAEALKSDVVRDFILSTYGGSVVPVF
ncbi:MAG: ABC transporter substrate-binding protein [Firmicutes bacterium]|jgi:D-methionine transport system substrate-binding protein|nr:ABC transporter substrate-binding protein [Bacillota bacterium]